MEVYFKNLTSEEVTADQLLEDLSALRTDAEELFQVTGGKFAEKSRASFLSALNRATAACHTLKDRTVKAAQTTDRAIRTHPYSVAGIAFGVGLLVGILTRRK